MAQKFLNGLHVSGTTQLDFMPSHESEGIIKIGRYDSNTSRYHNIKSYVSSTEASNYLKFSLHNGTANTVVDVLTLNGNKAATFAGGGNFGGDTTVYTGASTGSLSVGREAGQSIKLYITDTSNSITAAQDSDGNQAHNFILNRTFAGTGDNNFKIQKGGTDQFTLNSAGLATFAGSGTFETTLNVSATDGGSAPAMTAIMNMYGYEGRGVGIKMKDSVNSASGPTNREWFVGTGYGSSGFNIGYASDGSQSSYAAQNKLSITTSGNATFAGTISSGAITSTSNIEAQDTFILNYNNAGNKWQQLFDGSNGWNLRYYNDTTEAWSSNYINVNTSGNATFAGAVDVSGHLQAFSRVYLRESIQLVNKAVDGWLFFATRNTSGSEAVYDISNVGTLTAAGEIQGGSLDINGTADISGVLTLSKSTGSLIATSNTTDAFGYNATAGKGHYIRGTASTYIYGGGKFHDGSTLHTLLHDGSTISTNQISNLSGTNTGDQTLASLGAAAAAHNHDDRYYTETETDARFTSTNGTENDYTFKIADEGNFSGNKWYHVATTSSGNGGLHIRGFMSNHVEAFASQKFDLAIQVREGNDGGELEITGSLDVLHNNTSGTDKVGIRVIKSAENGTYDEFKVYIRTCRYSMVTLRLTEEGVTSFNTNHSSPLTTEPAPVSGGHVEIDTSSAVEGNYVVDNSTIKEIFHEGHLPTLTELGAQAAGSYLTDLTGAVLTSGNQTIAGVKQFSDYINASANIHMAGHLYNTDDNSSIDLKDHGNYTWFRNQAYSWVFQGGTGGDDWTRSFRFTLDAPGDSTEFNNKVMHIGQQQNNGSSGGKYKGIRIVKSTGSSSVVDGYLQAGDVVVTGNLTVGGTTTTLNTETVEVEDNIIVLNKTQSDNSATAATSGISIYRGLDSNDNAITQASLIFDDADDTWDLTNNLKIDGSLTIGASMYVPDYIYHIGDTGTHIQMDTGKLLIKNSGGKYINLHSNGINYHQATQHTFYNKIVCDNEILSDKGFITHNQRGISTSPHTVEEYPLGHYTGGKEIWSLDTTWSDSQLKQYFNSDNVEWFEDSTAPAGYSIKISGGVNTGAYYGSGFPYIPIEDGSIYLIEVYIRNTSGSVISHYMGTQDLDHAFASPTSGSGNPGSYGYHLMSNHNPGTDWQHRYAFVSGNHNSDVGKFETGAKYFTPHSLFNYGHTSGTRECYISGWRVTRIAEQEFFASGTAAKPSIVLHDGVYSSVPNSGFYREWYDGSTATKDQISVSTDGTRRLRVNEAGVWTDQNFYVGGDWRTFSPTWDASAGASGAGFRFHNTHADTNGVIALTVSATGNAVFAGEIEGASLDINGEANISDHLVVKGTTSTPLSSLFSGSLVVQGGDNEDPIIAVTDVNEANAAAGVFHQSSVSPGFPALVINAASDGNEQPLISARTNVNNSTGVGGTEVFAVDGDGDATFAGTISSGAITSSGNIQHTGLTMTTGSDVDQIYEAAMTFQLTANTWTDTGISGDDMGSGTYAMKVYVSDFNVGGGHYYEDYSALMTWHGGTTNSDTHDEIPVHRAGHAPNNGDVQFRTQRHANGYLMLQVKHNMTYSAALDNTDGGKIMRFKFRRLI
jgi:hypothetical protein